MTVTVTLPLAHIQEPSFQALSLITLVSSANLYVEDAEDRARRGSEARQTLSRAYRRLQDIQATDVVLDRVAVFTALVKAEQDLYAVLALTSDDLVIRNTVRALARLGRAQKALRRSDADQLRGLRVEPVLA